ncbi:hypothetical protein [Kitasatospora griseola]|uniref:hypothetical protein n=1 Tax=Kitasatospora griseola TaxID=2064 RepID=UPI00380F78A9
MREVLDEPLEPTLRRPANDSRALRAVGPEVGLPGCSPTAGTNCSSGNGKWRTFGAPPAELPAPATSL